MIIVLIFSMYEVYYKIKYNNSSCGIEILQISSNSMKPELSKGTMIIIKRQNEYEIGDIITFEQEDYLITHRIIEKYENEFVTKGDANNCQDESRVELDQIKGKVIMKLWK